MDRPPLAARSRHLVVGIRPPGGQRGRSHGGGRRLQRESATQLILPDDLAGGGGFSITLDSSSRSITAAQSQDLNGDGLDEVVLVDDRSIFNPDPRTDDQVHVIHGKADGDPVAAGAGHGGFSFDATRSDQGSGTFGGWAQIDGAGGLDLVLSAHEGELGTPEPAHVYVFCKETPE